MNVDELSKKQSQLGSQVLGKFEGANVLNFVSNQNEENLAQGD